MLSLVWFFLQLRFLIGDLNLGPGEKLHLQGNVISAAVKLLYACVWQEELIETPFLFDPLANEIGAELVPIVNAFANQLNDFTFKDQNFQVCFRDGQSHSSVNMEASTPLDSFSLGRPLDVPGRELVQPPVRACQVAPRGRHWSPRSGLRR